jgi:hypothetical protein
LPSAETWRRRGRTAQAMSLLLLARGLVAAVPFAHWRGRLGLSGDACVADLREAQVLAAHVNRGAARLGLPLKCLPRAMALSWLLQQRGIAHKVVLAARPASYRDGGNGLHAWLEVSGAIVIGEFSGPWIEVHAQG